MSSTTASPRPRRRVRELIEAKDPAFMASCRRIAASNRAELERLAALPAGHPDLIDTDDDGSVEVHNPADIRAELERAWGAPAAVRPDPAVQEPDATTWKRHWKRQLRRLTDLPLLAVGAGADRKAPANLRNGEMLVSWPTTVHTPAQIESAHKRICGAGTRTGKAADGLLVLDIDGKSALSWLLEQGCDPLEAQSWQIHRNTDPERLKVAWRLSGDQQKVLGQLKTKVETLAAVKDSKGKVVEKGQAVELFHGVGQVVVLGEHPTSKGFYWWPEGMGPEALAPIPPIWWEAVLQIAQPTAEPGVAASKKVSMSSRSAWRRLERCPICGRNERQFCSIHRDGKTIRCFHGSTFSPVQTHGALRAGQEITDMEGTVWAFSREQQSAGETFSIFVAPDPNKPRSRPAQPHAHAAAPAAPRLAPAEADAAHAGPAGPTPSAGGVVSRKTRVGSDEVLTLLPYHLGVLRLNVRNGEVHSSARGVISANEISRMYLELSRPFEVWSKDPTADGITLLASRDPFDPVREWLEGLEAEPLPLDQWNRLDHHLLGITDPIAAAFLPRFFISAVARTMEPGCYVRQAPVLIGAQERGKSELGRILFGADHWVEGVGALDRDALMKSHTSWGVELAELDGVSRRSDQEALKAFLTEVADTYRKPYDRAPERHARKFVFWGSANRPPLRDSSGSTRFVCIPIPDRPLPLEWARQHRDALWARALEQYHSGATWLGTSEAERLAVEARNADFTELDPWADPVAEFLRRAQAEGRLPVKVPEVLGHLEVPKERQTTAAAKRVREMAEGQGWRHARRWIGRDRPQGLWPPSDGHPGHTPDTPRGVCSDPSDANGSRHAGHPGHPFSQIVEEVGGGQESDTPATNTAPITQEVLSPEGCPVCPQPQIDCSAVDLAKPGGVSIGVSGGVSIPSTVTGWVELALAELRLAPDPPHLPEVHDWLQRHPAAPGCTRTALAAALERLRQEDADHDQPTLLDTP